MDLSKETRDHLRLLYCRYFIVPWRASACGVLFFGTLILAFGWVAFVLGIAVQAILPRRLPRLLGTALAVTLFILCRQHHWGPFVTAEWTGSHSVSLIVGMLGFLAFFSAGTAFFRGWRYQRFRQDPGWFMIPARRRLKAEQQFAREEADRKRYVETIDALHEKAGFHPSRDLNLESILARGGDGYGDYSLYKCPKCGRPVLMDFEMSNLIFNLNDFTEGAPMPMMSERASCPHCGLGIGGDNFPCINPPPFLVRERPKVEFIVAGPLIDQQLRVYQEWLLTRQEIHERGLDWIVREEPAAVAPPDSTA